MSAGVPLSLKFRPSRIVVGYFPVGAMKNILISSVQNPSVPVLSLTVPSGRFSTNFAPSVSCTDRSRLNVFAASSACMLWCPPIIM